MRVPDLRRTTLRRRYPSRAMAAEEWFRSSGWDEEARADFEARLARARGSNRPQYIRIKAFALRDAGRTAAAEALFRRVLDAYPDSLDAAHCAETLGDQSMSAGDFVTAEAHYRHALELRPDMNATSGEVHIGLAEALVAQGRHEDALAALEYVPVARLMVNHSVGRWNVALAEAALGVGEQQVAADAARRALALLDAPDQFTRHKGVGRAALTDDQVNRLRAIAAREAMKPTRKRAFLRWR